MWCECGRVQYGSCLFLIWSVQGVVRCGEKCSSVGCSERRTQYNANTNINIVALTP